MTLPQYGQPIVQGAGGGSSGPAWLASLPSTLPGDATEYLDGTGQFSTPPPATFGPFTFDVTFNDDAIKANHTTPLELVAAPGAGFTIVPAGAIMSILDAAGGAYVISGHFLSLLEGAWDIENGKIYYVIDFTSATVQTEITNGLIAVSVAAPDNEALILTASADYTGGDAANSLRVIGQYYVFPTV